PFRSPKLRMPPRPESTASDPVGSLAGATCAWTPAGGACYVSPTREDPNARARHTHPDFSDDASRGRNPQGFSRFGPDGARRVRVARLSFGRLVGDPALEVAVPAPGARTQPPFPRDLSQQQA